MRHRSVLVDVQTALTRVPVVALLGSRQTGKTTLAHMVIEASSRPAIYLDLELDSDLHALANPQLFLENHTGDLVVIDEIQRKPELLPLLRALVDRHRVPGRFMILGSASPSLLKLASDSLAGRIRMLEVTPFHLGEVPEESWQTLWLRGGYPESFLAWNDEESMQWRRDYLSAFLERDIPSLGIRIPAIQLRRAWTMLSHAQAQLWNASGMGDSLGLSAPTVKHYLDVLSDTFMARLLTPWYANIGKRLVKAPKVLIRDSGLVHALLGIGSMDALLSHPVAGHSWEAFCLESVIRSLNPGWQYWFYRTAAGSEMDLVLESPAGLRYGLEIKLGIGQKPARGFHNARADLGTKADYILTPGERTAPLDERASFMPPWTFIRDVLPKLE